MHNSLLLKEKYNYCVASVHEIVSLKKEERKKKRKGQISIINMKSVARKKKKIL